MSTEQIYKDCQERYSSLQRDHSIQKIHRTKFKIKRRLGQLQNKACFFQGQLNPITIENKALKEKLVELNRIVSFSADLLRNLIPVENSPTKKLKLQIAGLEEIAGMIREEWLEMKEEIRQLKEELAKRNERIAELQNKLQNTINTYEQTLSSTHSQYQSQLSTLNTLIQTLTQSLHNQQQTSKKQKQDLINSYSARLQQAEQLKQQFQKYMKEMNQKCANYEKVCQRLRDEIVQNLLEFQKSKENIKEIYEGLMQAKLEQQAKEFQYVLKLKDDQKVRVIEEMTAHAQQLKKKISQKNSQISHLSGINDQLKQQLGSIKDQIWQHKIKLDSCHKQLKQLSQKLHNEQENNRSLILKMKQNQGQLAEALQKMEKNKQIYEKELMEEKGRVRALEVKLDEERKVFQKKLQESEVKVQEFKRKLRENDQKFNQRLEQQKKRYDEMVLKFEQDTKQLRLDIEQSQNKLKQKQKEISKILSSNELQMRKLQQMHANTLRKMEAEHEQTMKRIQFENQEKIKQINRDYQLKMSEMEISNNQYVRKLVAEQNLKLYQQQCKFKSLQDSTSQQIKSLQTSLNQSRSQFEFMTQKLKRAEQQHKKILEEQRRQSQKRLEQQKSKLMSEMREQIRMFQKAMDEKQESYRSQLSQMQQSLQMLKQTNAIETIQQKYATMMNKLKQEMELQAKKLKEEKELALQKASEDFNKQLALLSKKLEFDISKLNEELLQEKEVHQFDKMTREEKINFLVQKINGYRNQMADKDNKIMDLLYEVQKKNKELSKIDELVLEKTRKIKYEFDQEMLETKAEFEMATNSIKNDCQAKIKKVETQRITFTKSVYDQFQDLKAKYDQEMYRLKRKYDELEKIFEERPSRAEDLSKIKELIQQKSKMDLQIKECKKKVKQANEIVKYLNLELENYKETYDIFGPGGEPLSPQRRFHTEADSPIRSLIRKQTIASEDNQKNSYTREKRMLTESPDLNEFRLFPPLGRNASQAVVEQDNESQISNHHQKEQSTLRKRAEKLQKPMFSSKVEIDDKSEELKSNASLFLGLINNRDQKLPVEMKLGSNGYTRRMSRRKTIAVSYDKKLQIKDKTLVLEP